MLRAFVGGIHRDQWIPRTKGQLRGKCFHLMTSSCPCGHISPQCKGWQQPVWGHLTVLHWGACFLGLCSRNVWWNQHNWASMRLKRTENRLFAQQLVLANIKGNIKAPCCWCFAVSSKKRTGNVKHVSMSWRHHSRLDFWSHFYQTRSAWSMDQGSNENHSPVNSFAPTVTKFCVTWEGQALPHDTEFGNCRDKIVDSRAFLSWSLIHGLSWSGLIKVGPGYRQLNYTNTLKSSFYGCVYQTSPNTMIIFNICTHCYNHSCNCLVNITRSPMDNNITQYGYQSDLYVFNERMTIHYSYVTWAAWCIKSPTIQLSFQQFLFQATKK